VSVSDGKATPGPLFSTVDAGFKIFIFDQEVGYVFITILIKAPLSTFWVARGSGT
jgi:hypothetical protein